ncbi:MAG: hypothetical protein ACFFD4_00030 [Candidatus Odinarchaeota archaeon]
MSGTWQTFLDNLRMEKDETGYRTEICDCNDGTCQLFYNSCTNRFDISGSCSELKLCAQIMKDKHLAKIQSHRFRKMEKAAKNDYRVNRLPAAGTTQPVSKTSRKSRTDLQYKSLASFF